MLSGSLIGVGLLVVHIVLAATVIYIFRTVRAADAPSSSPVPGSRNR